MSEQILSTNDQGEPRREPETNPQAALSASAPPPCSAPASSTTPLRGTLGSQPNASASSRGGGSGFLPADKSNLSSHTPTHNMDNVLKSSSHPDSHPRKNVLLQSQVSKMYWRGSLVDRIWDSNDKMKLELDNGEMTILTHKEFNEWRVNPV